MTARGRRAHRPAPASPPGLAWILLVLAAALIGGLAAAALVHASLIVAVIVSVVAAGFTVLAVRHSPALPRGQATYGPSSVSPPPGAPAPASASPPRMAPAPGPGETAVQMLPLPHQPGEDGRPADAPWWDPAPGAAPPPNPEAKRAPAPDLTTYLASTFIAQCPSCGAFRLDIRQAMNAWDFRCEACEYTWAWRPGTAWPPVRVMPARRREQSPPAAS